MVGRTWLWRSKHWILQLNDNDMGVKTEKDKSISKAAAKDNDTSAATSRASTRRGGYASLHWKKSGV